MDELTDGHSKKYRPSNRLMDELADGHSKKYRQTNRLMDELADGHSVAYHLYMYRKTNQFAGCNIIDARNSVVLKMKHLKFQTFYDN